MDAAEVVDGRLRQQPRTARLRAAVGERAVQPRERVRAQRAVDGQHLGAPDRRLGALEELVEAGRDQRVVEAAGHLDGRERRRDHARRGAEVAQRRADGLGDVLAGGLVDADVQPGDAERLGDLGADQLREAAAPVTRRARPATSQP